MAGRIRTHTQKKEINSKRSFTASNPQETNQNIHGAGRGKPTGNTELENSPTTEMRTFGNREA